MKLLIILLINLFIVANANSKIVFRVECDSPEGVRYSESIAHLQNNKIISGNYEADKFTDDGDKIEIIYDDANPKQIQLIWGDDIKYYQLYARNEKFYHWGFIDENYANGFYWGHWSISLPNKILTYYKGNTNSTGIGTGIANGMYSSKCILR